MRSLLSKFSDELKTSAPTWKVQARHAQDTMKTAMLGKQEQVVTSMHDAGLLVNQMPTYAREFVDQHNDWAIVALSVIRSPVQ
eukprot:gene3972-4332_t